MQVTTIRKTVWLLEVIKNKRLFVCHHCGYEADADDNASINIYNRFCVDVLRNTFHTLKDGQYVPLKMKRENVRIGLSKLFEADNECQRHLKSFQKL